MTYKKSKRAASHIEMAISFGMFVSFVVFLIFYLRPIRNQSIAEVLVDTVEIGASELASMQLIELPLLVNNVSTLCFRVPHPFSTYTQENLIVRNSTGGLVRFKLDINQDEVITEYSGSRYYLYYANVSFANLAYNPSNCSSLDETQYEYGAPRTYTTYFYPRLLELKQGYETAYSSLKQNLSFPQNAEFTLNITDTLGETTILALMRKKPLRVEVRAKDLPIEILNADGTIRKAILNIQVW